MAFSYELTLTAVVVEIHSSTPSATTVESVDTKNRVLICSQTPVRTSAWMSFQRSHFSGLSARD